MLLFFATLLIPAAFCFGQVNKENDLSKDDYLEDEIYKVVEVKPVFTGCEDIEDEAKRIECGRNEMLQFINDNLKYPNEAKQNEIEGTVYIIFVIEKDGSVTNPKIIRDIGGGCGDEAIRIVKLMPKWVPAKHEGRKVRMQFNLPVKFKLD